MDSLKTLMDNKSYELVIKLTENSRDPISLFYRISALLAVGQSQNALQVIEINRFILQEKLALLIKFHIEILCLLRRFDDAYNELEYYKNLPYESQEVEEILQAMPKYIRKEEMASASGPRQLDEEDIKKRLLCDNDEEVLAALDDIKASPINNYLIYILKLMRSHSRQVIRSFALLLLVNQKYDKEVDFLHFDKLIKVVPSSLEEPFIIPGYGTIDKLSYTLQSEYHDPSIAQNALQLISSYILYIYPQKISFTKDEIVVIFGYLAKKLLLIDDSDLEKVCFEKGLDYQKVLSDMKQIEEALKSF